jgi:hypothetical protein
MATATADFWFVTTIKYQYKHSPNNATVKPPEVPPQGEFRALQLNIHVVNYIWNYKKEIPVEL